MADGSKRLIKCRPTGFISRDWQNSRVRFTHNEIERKRRARLKSETDFLHQQLPKALYRDKLAIFKAGTDLLLRYSNSTDSEARSLILTDSEYSECVLNSFDGFGMRIRCLDGIILHATKNWEQCLGSGFTPLVGKTLSDLIVPSELTEEIIRDNLSLSSEECSQLSSGQPVPRTFILPVFDKPNSSDDLSESGCRLFECSGDIVMSPTVSSEENKPVLQVICRLIEHCSLGHSKPSDGGKLFSLRLQPDSHLIVEFQGHSLPAGVSSENMLGHSLVDLIVPASRSATEANLQNAERTGEATFTTSLEGAVSSSTPAQEFLVVTKAITVCDCLYCLIADFYPPQY
ncbi:hypothetical protein Aperf_G00000068560 [Anoplocephala perfoliata]